MSDAPIRQHYRGFFAIDDVLEAARGRWLQLLAELGVRADCLTGRHGPCPGCGGRDRFRFDDRDGEGTFICSQGGGGNLAGNGIALLNHALGWDFKRACEEIGSRLLRDEDRKGYDPARGAVEPIERQREALPPEPVAEAIGIPAYDEARLREFVRHVPDLTRGDLKRISPIQVEHATAADFLENLYDDKERVLVFTEFYSQGNFLYQVGSGSCRLSPDRGVKAVVSPLPTTAKEGVWYLCNPVTGKWEITEDKWKTERLPAGVHGPVRQVREAGKWGRRSWQCVTRYRYAVLESDNAPEHLWIKALWKLPVPIVAIYSSGGKSLHALVRIDASSKLEWDFIVRGAGANGQRRGFGLMTMVCPLGADANALTAVRLTRLPFCMREGSKDKSGKYVRYDRPRLQELIYLRSLPMRQKVKWDSMEQRYGEVRR